ncbi:MAG: hypothetical protein SF028_08865 [Candidatus Sumerlaeia bacterium]|nr:hypothetical protein [Candidatus Sumerlaeia bacterium]
MTPLENAAGRFGPTPPPGHRDWYAHEALRSLPRLVLMVDHNPYSPTYGCFDRSFWHYRTMDFPCGMNQEFCLPLALAYANEYPGNRYRGKERLRELALAAVDYAEKSSHADGTCDDYFPYERALGALVFSLYAMTESCLALGDRDPRRLEFFAKRGRWLISHNETGKLANHQAFAALALYNVFLCTRDEEFRRGSDQFRDLTLSWRHDEGWFQEYEGADPGYHSCLIAFLAKLWKKSRDESLLKPLHEAADFAWWFMHPDGSYAGEYGSRNTYHFYPHGFEVLAGLGNRKAGEIADGFLHRALPDRTRYFNDDDRMAAHYVYDWLHAWEDYAPERTGPAALPAEPEARWFPDARILAVRHRRYHFVLNGSKGGVFKVVTPKGAIASDTGPIGELADGRVFVTHIVDRDQSTAAHEGEGAVHKIVVEGVCQHRKVTLPTPLTMMVFRALLLTVGRFNANLVRSLLQRKLIVGKRRLPLRFRRTVELGTLEVTVTDELERKDPSLRLKRLSVGSDATSIYVANSNTFQESRLLPWQDAGGEIEEFNRTGRLVLERRIDVSGDA